MTDIGDASEEHYTPYRLALARALAGCKADAEVASVATALVRAVPLGKVAYLTAGEIHRLRCGVATWPQDLRAMVDFCLPSLAARHNGPGLAVRYRPGIGRWEVRRRAPTEASAVRHALPVGFPANDDRAALVNAIAAAAARLADLVRLHDEGLDAELAARCGWTAGHPDANVVPFDKAFTTTFQSTPGHPSLMLAAILAAITLAVTVCGDAPDGAA